MTHSSSGRAQQLCVANEWSAGLKPTVFQKALEVNSESWRSTRSHNENLDDGVSPDKEMGEAGGGGGGNGIEQCDGDGEGGGVGRGDGDDDSMDDDEHDNEVLEENRSGPEEEEEEEQQDPFQQDHVEVTD